jgi:uncharacterized membrane protein
MKKELKQPFVLVTAALIILWPISAIAATITFGSQLAQIPLLAILMTCLLSTLSGVTALLHAMKQEYERAGDIPRLWLFVSSKMFGSNVAGILMFFVAEGYQLTDAWQAASIILAAFGGGPLVERAVFSFANKYLPEVKP